MVFRVKSRTAPRRSRSPKAQPLTWRSLATAMATAALTAAAVPGGPAMAQGQNSAAAPNLFEEQARQLGVSQCAGVYAALGQGLTFGAAHAVQTETANTAPNSHAVEGLVGMTYDLPDMKGQAAGVVTAAPVGNGCEGHFVRVAPFQKSCEEVVSFLPPGSAPMADLEGVPLYDLGSGQGRALLLRSGASCIVVSIAQGWQGP